MLIAQRSLPHVGELDCAFRAGVHEPIAASGMELSSRDDLCQLFHVCRFDIDNIEALVLNVKVPQVDPKVVAADESLPIAVHRDAVDVICVCICICPPRDSCNDRIMMCHPWKLQS